MIDERMEEQACFYVLGVMTPEEEQEFEVALKQSPELQVVVSSLRVTRDAVAGSVPEMEPSFELKQRILAQISPSTTRERSHVSGSFSWINLWFSWGLTASLAIVCVTLLLHQSRLKSQLSQQASRVETLNQMAESLRSESNSLQRQMVTLRETNKLENVRIAMLNSLLADEPKAIAVSLWDNQQQKGVFVVQNLKPLPSDKDYQLWVLDPKYSTPVNAGVFQVDEQGRLRIDFKADKLIASADKFAVTMEPKGGLPTPTMKDLVMISN